jgi:hypothetical protein
MAKPILLIKLPSETPQDITDNIERKISAKVYDWHVLVSNGGRSGELICEAITPNNKLSELEKKRIRMIFENVYSKPLPLWLILFGSHEKRKQFYNNRIRLFSNEL